MDIHSLPFTELLQKAIDGSAEAAGVLHERFASHLRRVIRRKLAAPLRRFFDSHDFLQDVWASFYAAPPVPGTFTEPDQLVAYLAGMASHKVTDAFRCRMQTAKHNGNGQVPFDSHALRQSRLHAAHTPSPSERLVLEEEWDRLLDAQPPQRRRMLELLRLGYNPVQIAAKVDVCAKTVRRFFHSLARQIAS